MTPPLPTNRCFVEAERNSDYFLGRISILLTSVTLIISTAGWKSLKCARNKSEIYPQFCLY